MKEFKKVTKLLEYHSSSFFWKTCLQSSSCCLIRGGRGAGANERFLVVSAGFGCREVGGAAASGGGVGAAVFIAAWRSAGTRLCASASGGACAAVPEACAWGGFVVSNLPAGLMVLAGASQLGLRPVGRRGRRPTERGGRQRSMLMG
ncbi:hypothetical protein [Roseateles sp. BYS96W]|uniref:hypothetical protein n=1 Tax=Pelomonas nitida TaxID=3299027 RepID=UPI003749C42C